MRGGTAKVILVTFSFIEGVVGIGLPFVILGPLLHILPGKLSPSVALIVFAVVAFAFYFVIRLIFRNFEQRLLQIAKTESSEKPEGSDPAP